MLTLQVSYRTIALVFTIVCLGFGCVLFFWPDLLMTANRISKKWVPTNGLEEQLNRTRDVDTKLLSVRKVIGVILFLLALAFIVIALR